mgnify:CR=1 FL=1
MKEQCIFAGFGGQGMLLIGKFLAEAGMESGKHVSWLPSYGPEMRGGTANCSVVVSDKPVASPLISVADTVLAMNLPSMLKFQSEVKPGGLLLLGAADRKAALAQKLLHGVLRVEHGKRLTCVRVLHEATSDQNAPDLCLTAEV